MRICKGCECSIEHMNKNTIFCSKKCRVKWNYYNNEEYRQKKLQEHFDEKGLKIYKIIHNGNVIYIGKTILRLYTRKSNGYTSIPKEILKASTIELIEYTNDASRERYWIKFYTEQGCQLYNKRKGEGLDKKEYYRNYYKEYHKLKKINGKVNNVVGG